MYFYSDEDSIDNGILGCINCLESLADDGVYWPGKEKKIRETIAGLKKVSDEMCVC